MIDQSSDTIDSQCVRYSRVAARQEDLAEYVTRVTKEKNLSTFDVEKRGGPTHGTVHNIMRGHTKNVKRDTLIALARGLGRPVEEIFAVTYEGAGRSRTFRAAILNAMCADFESLSDSDQKTLLPLVEKLYELISDSKKKK